MTAASAQGEPWAGAPPSPRQIQSWQDAEVNAVAWMRHWGYVDAELTTAGAGGGLDVRSTDAVAQVKYLAAAVGRPDLQRLVGAAAAAPGTQLLFFTGSDYSATAVEFANLVGIALFRYSLNGAMSPVNEVARRIARPTTFTPGSASAPPSSAAATAIGWGRSASAGRTSVAGTTTAAWSTSTRLPPMSSLPPAD